MSFRYVAIAPGGEQVRGHIDVASEEQAERALWDAEYRVVSLRAVRALPTAETVFPSLFAVKKRSLITFARQLATLIDSGVPVMRCLELLEEQSDSKPLARAIRGITRAVRGGSSFADAIRAQPRVFPPMFGRMVELGERTGHLEATLREVATYMEREEEVAGRVRSAMAYPAFLIVLAVIVIVILTTTALPALVNMFKEFNADLPLPTRILIGFTDFTTAYRTQLFAGIAITVQGKRDQELLRIDARHDGRGNPYYWIAFGRGGIAGAAHGSDLAALNEKRIAVTPLRLDLTDEPFMTKLAEVFN